MAFDSVAEPEPAATLLFLVNLCRGLASPDQIAVVMARGLALLPGIADARVVVQGDPLDLAALPAPEAAGTTGGQTLIDPEDCAAPDRFRFPISIRDMQYGMVTVTVSDMDSFAAIPPHLHNALNLVALELDHRRHAASLGDIVQAKTAELRTALDEVNRAAESERTANTAKTIFLANVSHELRTPLNAIIGFSELIQAELFGPVGQPRYRDYIDDILVSARLLHEQVDHLLDLSKVQARAVALEETEADLALVTAEAERTLGVLARRADVVLSCRLPSLTLLADPRLLRHALINIVANAIKFTPAGGHVTVGTGRNAQAIWLTVRDDGCGIPADQLSRVLEPFQTGDPQIRQPGSGTGLGLPLARAYLGLHGGWLEIESELDVGTEVRLMLPVSRLRAAGRAVS